MVARPVLDHRALEFAQPGPKRQPQFRKPVLPDVDMRGFLDRKPQAGCAVFQNRRRDPEGWRAVEHALNASAIAGCLGEKRILESEPRSLGFKRGFDFGHDEDQVAHVTIDKIPTIAKKLVLDVLDETLGAIKPDRLLAPDQHPQQAVKADEMVDMCVRDKDMLKALDLSR